MNKPAIVVLISGNGSNLQAIIDAIDHGQINARIAAVISNRPAVFGLERAEKAGLNTVVVDHTKYPDRASFDQELAREIDKLNPQLVVLAGFMRILSDEFVEHYRGRMLNIHPSLLPKYRGLNTHERAIFNKDAEHGVTVHFVTPELDGGPLIIQAKTAVEDGETPESLANKVHALEHKIYPLAINWFVTDRLRLADDQISFDGKPLKKPVEYNDNLS